MASNYQVIQLLGGQWVARYLLQDGWEQHQFPTRTEAVKEVKAGFTYNNPHKTLKTSEISFGEEEVSSVINIKWK